jgi:putative ABC transport system permease protein
MFKNYLKTAYRSLLRYRSAALIKLSGLSLGMACCMLIVIYISDELSYNRFNLHYRDIYRVNFVKHGDGETRVMAGTPNAAGPAIQKDLLVVVPLSGKNPSALSSGVDGALRARMNQWLHDFAYRIDLSWWMFAVAGLFAVLISLLTVGVQGGRVARVNIVKSLRNF